MSAAGAWKALEHLNAVSVAPGGKKLKVSVGRKEKALLDELDSCASGEGDKEPDGIRAGLETVLASWRRR